METLQTPDVQARFIQETPEQALARLVAMVNEIPGHGPMMQPSFEQPLNTGEMTSPHTTISEPSVPQRNAVNNSPFRAGYIARRPVAETIEMPELPYTRTASQLFSSNTYKVGQEYTFTTPGDLSDRSQEMKMQGVAADTFTYPETDKPRITEHQQDGSMILRGETTYTVIQPRIEAAQGSVEAPTTPRRSILRKLGNFVFRTATASTILFPVIDAIMARR